MLRRTLPALGLLIALLSGAPARADDLDALLAAARKEGPMIWYISFYGGEAPARTAAAFAKKYPGVTVEPVRLTSGGIFQRLNQDLRNHVANASVYTSSIGGQFDTLVQSGALAQFTPQNADAIAPALRAAIIPGYAYPLGTGLMALAYNSAKVQPADAPTSWKALLDPKWKGRLAVGDPSFSGFDAVWDVTMTSMYGWSYYESLAKNDPLIQRSTFDGLTALNSGERLVAALPDAIVIDSAAKGNPVKVVYPSDGSIMIVGLTAILKDAPQPATARLFTEFLLGAEHGKILSEVHYQSGRSDAVNALADGKTLKDIPLAPLLSAKAFSDALPDLIERWRDLFSH